MAINYRMVAIQKKFPSRGLVFKFKKANSHSNKADGESRQREPTMVRIWLATDIQNDP